MMTLISCASLSCSSVMVAEKDASEAIRSVVATLMIWFSLQENYDLGEDLFSSKTMTPSIQQKLNRKGSKTTRRMFWSGQVKAQNSVHLRNCGWTWKELFTPDPQATWQRLSCLGRMEEKLQCPDVPAWLRHNHTDSVSHSAVIAAKGASTKY